MGGAIGLRAAATALRGRIQRLVLNDIGPELAAPAVERIRAYAGSPPAFATMQRAGAVLPHRLQALRLADRRAVAAAHRDLVRRLPDGRVTPHYDPAMVQQFIAHPQDYDQWDAWDALTMPVLVPARATVRPAAARCGRGHAQPRPAGGGGHHPRLRPRAGAEHAGTVRAGRAVLQRLS
jgi:hypothetical protein